MRLALHAVDVGRSGRAACGKALDAAGVARCRRWAQQARCVRQVSAAAGDVWIGLRRWGPLQYTVVSIERLSHSDRGRPAGDLGSG